MIKNIVTGILNQVTLIKLINFKENIMFAKKDNLESLKILDLGLSVKIEKYFDKQRCGTIIYMAPEQLSGKGYTKSVDIWAAGIILYILCSGGQHPIFLKNTSLDAYINAVSKLEKWQFTFKFWKLARNLFLRMCKINYNIRLPAYKCKIHPWITRDPDSPLPLSNLESWKKRTVTRDFKEVIF